MTTADLDSLEPAGDRYADMRAVHGDTKEPEAS
jgi:hypothetical protein